MHPVCSVYLYSALGQNANTAAGIRTVAMDMWEPYICVTTQYVPEGLEKIAFDEFYVAISGTP